MHASRTSHRLAGSMAALALATALAACGGQSTDDAVEEVPTETDAPTSTEAAATGVTVDAIAPATVTAGAAVPVTVEVKGITLVKADQDTSGATGHLHVFIDRQPTPAGQPIPVEAGVIHTASTTIEVAGLAAGEHTLWVVAGNGAHVPFEGATDKVTVTVS